jgi:hypothetical protein
MRTRHRGAMPLRSTGSRCLVVPTA